MDTAIKVFIIYDDPTSHPEHQYRQYLQLFLKGKMTAMFI